MCKTLKINSAIRHLDTALKVLLLAIIVQTGTSKMMKQAYANYVRLVVDVSQTMKKKYALRIDTAQTTSILPTAFSAPMVLSPILQA